MHCVSAHKLLTLELFMMIKLLAVQHRKNPGKINQGTSETGQTHEVYTALVYQVSLVPACVRKYNTMIGERCSEDNVIMLQKMF